MKGLRVLIADDEKLARFSLHSMLEEIGVPARSISSAADGEAMVEAVRRIMPDVAFVDIRMPRLDGLTGIERAHAVSPTTHWIVLTSHSSFDYARTALSLGVEEYLLKPVSPEELGKVLARVVSARRREFVLANDEFEGCASSMLSGTQSMGDGVPELFRQGRFLGAYVLCDGAMGRADLLERQRAACRGIRERLAAAAESRLRSALCALTEGRLCLLWAWPTAGEEATLRELAQGQLKTLQITLDNAHRKDMRVTMIVCGPCSGFLELRREMEEACSLAALRVSLGIGRLLSLGELREASRGGEAPLCAALERAALAWRSGGRLELSAEISAARRAWAEAGRAYRKDPAPQRIQSYLGAVFGYRPASGTTDSWIDGLEAHAAALGDARTGAGGRLVDEVVAFVRANYADTGGIGRIAARLGVTPNYLSSLFHRVQGVTFVRYVTGLRMEKARDLLAGGARVHEVARAVGYTSTRHFSALFVQRYNQKPSDFQRGGTRAEKSALET